MLHKNLDPMIQINIRIFKKSALFEFTISNDEKTDQRGKAKVGYMKKKVSLHHQTKTNSRDLFSVDISGLVPSFGNSAAPLIMLQRLLQTRISNSN